jgi:predicted lipoprotein with Yx(FWY)xxD motif
MIMKRRLPLTVAPFAAAGIAIAVAGCGGGSHTGMSGSGYAAAGSGTTVNAATVGKRATKLGQVLVDSQGRTLYLFEKDKGTASSCTGACASVWPPVTTGGQKLVGRGVSTAKLGSTKRADGKTEATYAGHPLYTYAGDAKPGDTKGQGLDQFGAEWYVLAPSGHKIDDDH